MPMKPIKPEYSKFLKQYNKIQIHLKDVPELFHAFNITKNRWSIYLVEDLSKITWARKLYIVYKIMTLRLLVLFMSKRKLSYPRKDDGLSEP